MIPNYKPFFARKSIEKYLKDNWQEITLIFFASIYFLYFNTASFLRYTNFYTSYDGVTWSQLGNADVAGPTSALNVGTVDVFVGQNANQSELLTGRIYRAQIYNGINGTLAVDFNPNLSTSAQTFTAATGEVWTTNGTARIYGNTHATYGIPAWWDANGPRGFLPEGQTQNVILQCQILHVGAQAVKFVLMTMVMGFTAQLL